MTVPEAQLQLLCYWPSCWSRPARRPATRPPALQGTNAGAARLAGPKSRYTTWSLQLMRSGARSHGSAAKPDQLLAGLSNAEIESLDAHLASRR
jgi:cytochrome c553